MDVADSQYRPSTSARYARPISDRLVISVIKSFFHPEIIRTIRKMKIQYFFFVLRVMRHFRISSIFMDKFTS